MSEFMLKFGRKPVACRRAEFLFWFVAVPFRVDPQTGILRTTRRLDYDTGDRVFTLKICTSSLRTRKRKRKCKTEVGLINVFIRDINDNPPVFSQSIYKHSVASMFPIGTTVASPFAYDIIDTVVSNYTYSIQSNDATQYVDIDPKSGIVTLNTNFRSIKESVSHLEYTLFARDNKKRHLYGKAILSIQVFHPERTTRPGKSNSIWPPYTISEDTIKNNRHSDNKCCCIVPCPPKSHRYMYPLS